jgi:hypothetical protein
MSVRERISQFCVDYFLGKVVDCIVIPAGGLVLSALAVFFAWMLNLPWPLIGLISILVFILGVLAMYPLLIIIRQVKNTKTIVRPIKKPSRLEWDNVLWEDGGRYYWGGGVVVKGPLCPKCKTMLCTERNGEIDSNPREDTIISDSSYHSRLKCLKCDKIYLLGTKQKTIKQSDNEVATLFEGKRRRDAERLKMKTLKLGHNEVMTKRTNKKKPPKDINLLAAYIVQQSTTKSENKADTPCLKPNLPPNSHPQ